MEILGIAFAIMLCLTLISVTIRTFTENNLINIISLICFCLFVISWMLFIGANIGYKEGKRTEYKNILRNKPSFKYEVKYIQKDSTYVPIDTIYIKIK